MKRFKPTDLLVGIIFALFFISLSVVITINFRPLYYLDVNLLNIEEISGYDKADILANYNTLIDYSSPFYRGELKFPTLPSSEAGLQHFEEVKNIFISFYILMLITFLACVVIILAKAKKKNYSYMPVASATAVLLPLLLGLFMAIDFDTSFVIFHKIFFNNDYWIFDPTTDPVIRILPDTFFMHSAILMILLILVESFIFYLIYRKLVKIKSIRYRKNKGLAL